MVDMLADLDMQVAVLDREIARRAKKDEAAKQLMTIPGIGPIAATAIIALAPSVETFRKGRDFAAWPRPPSALDRRQTAARQHIEDGRADDQTTTDHRRQLNGTPGMPVWRACRLVA